MVSRPKFGPDTSKHVPLPAMPIIRRSEATKEAVLVCANHEDPTHKPVSAAGEILALLSTHTTMLRTTGWHVLIGIEEPPTEGGWARQDSRRIVPVRCYVCRVCGYVELYSGMITDQDTWSKQGMRG
jgi:hypothetical protein